MSASNRSPAHSHGVGILDDAPCGQPLDACADENGLGMCEYLRAETSAGE